MSHNATNNESAPNKLENLYLPGRNDVLCSIFYTLICIVIHAVIQEYGLDKLNKKLHLSKTKYSKFNESGQLAVFYLVSAIWGAHLIYTENYLTRLSDLWETYPNIPLTFWVKFYFIFQICYWLHNYPELYFQKVKRDEISARLVYTTLYLFAVLMPYVLNMTRLGLVLLVTNYIVECIFHISRLIYFSGKLKYAKIGFYLWDFLFVCTRIFCTALAFLYFHVGLEQSNQPTIKIAEGNFNTKIVRLNGLVFIFVTQLYMMWNFLTFHMKRWREKAASVGKSGSASLLGSSQKKKDMIKKKNKKDDDDLNELPEADQNHQKELRQRKSKARS